jgi:hypothetical protein
MKSPSSPYLPAVLAAMGWWLALAGAAHAYIDPGAGSLIWQMLIAGALTAAFFLRRYWVKLRSVVGGKGTEAANPDDDEPNT